MISLKNTLKAIRDKLNEHEEDLRKSAWYVTSNKITSNASSSSGTTTTKTLTWTGIPTNATNFVFVPTEQKWCTPSEVTYSQNGTSVTVTISCNCTVSTAIMRIGGVLMYQLS